MSNLPPTREDVLTALREPNVWDVIVIGGGATGLGTAVDAAARGYRTLLVEGADFAKGTSSRSTKLIHGGVRYLAQGNIPLVREALRERGFLRSNAPHLVQRMGFVIPAYTWSAQPFYWAGLTIYDLLAGQLSFGACRWLSKAQALARTPNLHQAGLRGGVLYYDGQFDDARLAITLLRTVFDHGGTALNYLPVTALLKQNRRVTGVVAHNSETGEEFRLRAKAVVNATGVFVDAVRRMDDAESADMLTPSQGIHLVVDRRFQPGDCAMMIPKTEDGRVLFALPWHGKVIIGTTDTPVERVSLEPRALEEEISFVLRTAGRFLAQAPTRGDVRSVFAGQRPLVKRGSTDGSTAKISREHLIQISRSGLITITGGKWTTYRKMGEDAVDEAIKIGGLEKRPARTAGLRLHGWLESCADDLERTYGSDAGEIRTKPGIQQTVHPAFTLTAAEIRWAAQTELARTVEDVLARRSRALFLDARASIAAAPAVGAILAAELERDAEWVREQVTAYTDLARRYLLTY